MRMKRTRAVHSKSRTGCHTCKKRRIKCDETRPSCKRCLTGKRSCDGYEIIIDAPKRSFYEISHLDKRTPPDIRPMLTISPRSLPNLDSIELHGFELFCSNTIPELAGLRSSGFWRNVVLPACYSEPALLHASIGLACASKSRAEQTIAPSNTYVQNKRLIAVAEYNKSIRFLQEHIEKHEEAGSLRIVLIACVMFTTFELFSGRVGKAAMHLENGRKLLIQLYRTPKKRSAIAGPDSESTRLYFAQRPESVEDYLINIFAHMDLQATYFGSERPLLKLTARDDATTPKNNSGTGLDFLTIPKYFSSLHEANQYLVILINECLDFRGHAFDQTQHTICDRQSNLKRQYLASSLRQWRQAYGQPSLTATLLEKSDRSWKSQSALMLIQHAWLSIILLSSYIEFEETEFDSYHPHFQTIVNYTSFIYSPEGEGESLNRKHFSLELGLVPPLWWTVMKCRHTKLRHKAHWLLGQVGREGIWDPILMHQIGSETMLLEETWATEDSGLSSPLSLTDQDATFDDQVDLKAQVPLRYRVSAATVSSVDEDKEIIQMTFTRKQWDAGGYWTGEFEQIVREKHVESLSASQFLDSTAERTTSKWRWPSRNIFTTEIDSSPDWLRKNS